MFYLGILRRILRMSASFDPQMEVTCGRCQRCGRPELTTSGLLLTPETDPAFHLGTSIYKDHCISKIFWYMRLSFLPKLYVNFCNVKN